MTVAHESDDHNMIKNLNSVALVHYLMLSCLILGHLRLFVVFVTCIFSCTFVVYQCEWCIAHNSGNLLTELTKLLQIATSSENLLPFVEELLSDSANYPARLLADVLMILLVPPTNIALIQSFPEDIVSDDQQWSLSPLCTALSNSSLSDLISLTCTNSCEKLDIVLYCLLCCKLQHFQGDLFDDERIESNGPAVDKDGLVSSMHSVTKTLLSADAALPVGTTVPMNGADLAVSVSSLMQTSSRAKEVSIDCSGEESIIREIFDSLQRTCQSHPHSMKLLDNSLFGKLLHAHPEHSPVHNPSMNTSFFIDAKTLLDHCMANLSPACSKIAGLLVNRSQVLMQHFVAHSAVRVDELEKCHSSGNIEEITRIHSYLYVMAKFFKALDIHGTCKLVFVHTEHLEFFEGFNFLR